MPTHAVHIGVIADLHLGSIFGLLPPGFRTSAGAVATLNAGQQYLWRCWLRTARWFASHHVDAVVVNGDVIDGRQPQQRGTELSLPLLADQVEAAALALKALAAPALYFIQGTEYHDQKAAQAVEEVAARFAASSLLPPGSGLSSGRYSKEVLDLDAGGVILNFAHGVSAAREFYRAAGIDREALWCALAGKDGRAPRADCVVRSHQHCFVHLEHARRHGVITPCWQLQTRFMRKTSVYRMIPDIGGVIVCVDPQAKRRGMDPITVKKLVFPLPERKPAKLTCLP